MGLKHGLGKLEHGVGAKSPIWGGKKPPEAAPPPDYRAWFHPKGVRAGAGTIIHPRLDKIFTKWVAIKDLGAFVPGIDAESRRGSF